MTLLSFTNNKFAIEVIVAHVFIVAVVVWQLFFRTKLPALRSWLGRYGLWLAWLVALGATSGSLFYSNIAGFAPCELCWFQRIFLYPLVALLLVGVVKKSREVADHGLVLACVGAAISLYHNVIYYSAGGLRSICSVGANGVGVSCVKRYVFLMGYVTIPMMALTAFVLVIIFLLFYRNATTSTT